MCDYDRRFQIGRVCGRSGTGRSCVVEKGIILCLFLNHRTMVTQRLLLRRAVFFEGESFWLGQTSLGLADRALSQIMGQDDRLKLSFWGKVRLVQSVLD